MVSLTRPRVRRDQVGDDDWNDWRWQLRNMLTRAGDFETLFALTDDEKRGLRRRPICFASAPRPTTPA